MKKDMKNINQFYDLNFMNDQMNTLLFLCYIYFRGLFSTTKLD